MLVKRKREDHHLDDLRETFETLHLYDIKLNTSKCVFGVSSSKFLGFMVSQRGAETNPDKIQATLEITPPKNIKNVYSLNGRVTTLNRFISRATNNACHFSRRWKRPLSGPMNVWKLSRSWRYILHLHRCSTHPSPTKAFLYAISLTIVSLALIQEEDRMQLPMYYTSRALKEAKERYPPMEKLAFAMITVVPKFKPYF